MSEIPVGSKWRDNDPRCRHRVVIVLQVSEGFVYYRFIVRTRSRRDRFLKAFTRES